MNVEFVDDLTPYREMKVRMLNGTHTAMVPVGYLAGLRSVNEVMDNANVSDFIKTLLVEEVAKTLGQKNRNGRQQPQSKGTGRAAMELPASVTLGPKR